MLFSVNLLVQLLEFLVVQTDRLDLMAVFVAQLRNYLVSQLALLSQLVTAVANGDIFAAELM